jgi:hypothetical protein
MPLRYDKLAVRYDATVQITNINTWLHDLSNRAQLVTRR